MFDHSSASDLCVTVGVAAVAAMAVASLSKSSSFAAGTECSARLAKPVSARATVTTSVSAEPTGGGEETMPTTSPFENEELWTSSDGPTNDTGRRPRGSMDPKVINAKREVQAQLPPQPTFSSKLGNTVIIPGRAANLDDANTPAVTGTLFYQSEAYADRVRANSEAAA